MSGQVDAVMAVDKPAEVNPLGLALKYAEMGWYVFPCTSSKQPYTIHGMKDATTDQAAITLWWNEWPDALIGIYCERSGLFCLDIDVDHGNGVNGFFSLAELIDKVGNSQALLPLVGPVQSTPRGGQHYLFKMPQGMDIPNNANKLGAGLDLRSNGYICTGAGYSWFPGHGPDTPLTDAPDWLLNEIGKHGAKIAVTQGNSLRRNNGYHHKKDGDYWLERALKMAVPGTRNETGFWLGCQLRDRGLTLDEAEQILLIYSSKVTGDGYTEEEALASVKSAFSSPPRNPAKSTDENAYHGIVFSDVQLDNQSAEVAKDPSRPAIKTRWTVAELYDTNLPDPKWAIPGLIPEGLTLLGGRPKVGKSWLALQMAHSVGTGGIMFEHKVERGNTLFIALEDGPRRLQERIRKHGIPRDALITFERSWPPLQEEGMGLLYAEIINNDYRLIVVDTLTRAFRGLDQNDQPVINAVMSEIQSMCQNHHLAMVFNDHTNKPKGFVSDPIDDIMNSTVKTAVSDQVLALYRDAGQARATLRGRGRDLEDIDLLLRWDAMTCCWQCEGQAGDVKMTEERLEILDALESIGKSQAPAIARYLGKDRSNIAHQLNDLYSSQKVRREVNGNNVYYEKM